MQWLVCTYNNSIDLCHIFKVSKHLQKTTSNRICKFYQGFVSIVYMYVRSDVIKEDQRTFTKNFLREKKIRRTEQTVSKTRSKYILYIIRGMISIDSRREATRLQPPNGKTPSRKKSGPSAVFRRLKKHNRRVVSPGGPRASLPSLFRKWKFPLWPRPNRNLA